MSLATSIQSKRKGMNRTRRLSTTGSGLSGEVIINIPPKANSILIENVGSNIIRFVFDGDSFPNYFELKPSNGILSRVEFAVNNGKDIKVRSTVGIGAIQYILSD